MEPNYVANFTLERAVDGSTFVGLLDYGLDVLIRRKVRLVNVKCHEPSTLAGAAAQEFVEGLLRGRKLRCKTLRDQYRKWNTVLAVLYAKESGGGWLNVNDILASRMMGGGSAGPDEKMG